jgi:hypothetical protein
LKEKIVLTTVIVAAVGIAAVTKEKSNPNSNEILFFSFLVFFIIVVFVRDISHKHSWHAKIAMMSRRIDENRGSSCILLNDHECSSE